MNIIESNLHLDMARIKTTPIPSESHKNDSKHRRAGKSKEAEKKSTVVDGVKNKRKNRPGMGIIKEIRKLQTGKVKKMTSGAAFERLLRELISDLVPTGLRVKKIAIVALKEIAELYMTDVFEKASVMAWHAHRVSIKPIDVKLGMLMENNSETMRRYSHQAMAEYAERLAKNAKKHSRNKAKENYKKNKEKKKEHTEVISELPTSNENPVTSEDPVTLENQVIPENPVILEPSVTHEKRKRESREERKLRKEKESKGEKKSKRSNGSSHKKKHRHEERDVTEDSVEVNTEVEDQVQESSEQVQENVIQSNKLDTISDGKGNEESNSEDDKNDSQYY